MRLRRNALKAVQFVRYEFQTNENLTFTVSWALYSDITFGVKLKEARYAVDKILDQFRRMRFDGLTLCSLRYISYDMNWACFNFIVRGLDWYILTAKDKRLIWRKYCLQANVPDLNFISTKIIFHEHPLTHEAKFNQTDIHFQPFQLFHLVEHTGLAVIKS